MDAGTTAAVHALAAAAGCTDYVVLLAAFAAMIGGRSGQAEFLIGTPVANRPDRTAEQLVGSSPTRSSYGWTPGATRWRGNCWSGSAAPASPRCATRTSRSRRSSRRWHRERDLTGSPLFQVMFAFDNTPPPRLDLPGAAVETVAMGNPLTRFDITLALTERDGRIEGLCEFDADLFDAADVESMLADFASTAGGFAADADRTLSAIRGPAAAGPPLAAVPAQAPGPRAGRGRSGEAAGEIEATVAAIWSEVLGGGVEITDPHADFFDLGGHSFLAARISSG